MTDNEIAKQIEGRLGVKIEVDDKGPAETLQHKYLLQDNMFDIVFLLSRARRIGYDLFAVEDGKNGSKKPSRLIFKPSTDIRSTRIELKYGLTLIEFSPELSTFNQVGKVTVKGWDAVRKKPISETVTLKKLKSKGLLNKTGQEKLESGFADREEVITNRPIHSVGEARQLARETLQSIVKDMVKGSGSVVGLPHLRTGCLLDFKGLGERFDGAYFVTGTTHTIGDGGYTTRFECRME